MPSSSPSLSSSGPAPAPLSPSGGALCETVEQSFHSTSPAAHGPGEKKGLAPCTLAKAPTEQVDETSVRNAPRAVDGGGVTDGSGSLCAADDARGGRLVSNVAPLLSPPPLLPRAPPPSPVDVKSQKERSSNNTPVCTPEPASKTAVSHQVQAWEEDAPDSRLPMRGAIDDDSAGPRKRGENLAQDEGDYGTVAVQGDRHVATASPSSKKRKERNRTVPVDLLALSTSSLRVLAIALGLEPKAQSTKGITSTTLSASHSNHVAEDTGGALKEDKERYCTFIRDKLLAL